MRQHTGARTIATTMSGLILENTMEGVDFIFSLALTTYRDLKGDGLWNTAMLVLPVQQEASWPLIKLSAPFAGIVNQLITHFLNAPKLEIKQQ
jgi:hypothetical protein